MSAGNWLAGVRIDVDRNPDNDFTTRRYWKASATFWGDTKPSYFSIGSTPERAIINLSLYLMEQRPASGGAAPGKVERDGVDRTFHVQV